jgi:hypothetical protein
MDAQLPELEEKAATPNEFQTGRLTFELPGDGEIAAIFFPKVCTVCTCSGPCTSCSCTAIEKPETGEQSERVGHTESTSVS